MYDDLIELFLTGESGERIINSLPIVIYATDTEGRLKYFNSAAVELWGRKPETGNGRWFAPWKLYHPNGTSIPYEESSMAVCVKEGHRMEGIEIISERPDGEQVWFRAFSSPLQDEAEEIIGCINLLVDVTHQKMAENQLRQQNQELSDFFENAAVGLHWVDADGIIKKVNQAELDMLGYSRQEFVGRHIRDFHADKDVIDEITKKLSAGEEIHDREIRLKRKDGSIQHVLMSSNVYRKNGKFIHTRCINRDITSRRKAQKELSDVTSRAEQQKRLYETIISSTPDLVYVFDLNYRFTFANEALLEMWGLTREESIGKTLLEVGYEPWHAEMHEREIDQVVATKQPVQGEVSFPHAKLGPRIYDYIFVPVFDENRNVEAVAGTTRDITQRKEAEEALRRSEEKYRTLFETMDDGFVILKVLFDDNDNPVDFRYLEANPASEKHSGLSDRVGKKVSEVLPELEEEWLRAYGNVAITGEPAHFESYIEKLQRWFDISAFRVGEPEERKVAVIFKNITDRKETREQLKTMNETLEKRVEERTKSLISYQNQLRSLASQLNKAEEKQREQLAAELHDNLGQLLAVGKLKIDQLRYDKASKSVGELEEIIDDALTYTRKLMSSLKPPPSIEDDLRASIGWVADKLAKHGLKVIIDDDKQPKQLDEEVRGIVIQCVRELLFNVLKHTSEKEAVVTLRNKKDQLQITVKDEGEGFSAQNMELIPEKDGKFGLFNIRERIDLLGGTLDIEARQGKGTKVTLYVPLAEEHKVAGTIGQRRDVEQVNNFKSEERIKVLIADDHQMFREGIRKIIEEEEDIVVVGEAADGEEAIHLTNDRAPDIILMDINMPVMDGIEATRKIISQIPNIRIIGLSLYDGDGVAEDMRNAGASAYLTKTEAFESLIVTIRAESSNATG